ncbi:MAG: 4Fe-4S binding protein [Chloroflexi bacterium]|nr:4Fe-4S binding protein [Chloroflexota bacterium]
MFDILRASLRAARVTTAYPEKAEPAPPAYRGRPALDPSACDASGACVDICPAQAIALGGQGGAAHWRLDLARCVFCGLCQETCPTGALALTNEYELAALRREDLITSVALTIAGGAARTRPALPAPGPSGDAALLRQAAGLLTRRIKSRLRRSLHIRHMDAGSDNSADWELNALLNPFYDIQRLGIDVVASPRHADLLFVTGAVTRNMEQALRLTYEAMPEPRLVAAVGAEACGGGVLQGSYAVAGGVDRCLPVEVYIPGDPPRPLALIHGLLLALDRLPSRP